MSGDLLSQVKLGFFNVLLPNFCFTLIINRMHAGERLYIHLWLTSSILVNQ